MSRLLADFSFGAYAMAWRVSTPLLKLYLKQRAKRGKEIATRLPERLGYDPRARPYGPLIWLHAASVGESLAVLPLVTHLRRHYPQLNLLMTSGTVTSATLLEQRLPPGVLHAFVPADLPAAVERFLDHWQPSLAIFVESELWPNLLRQASKAGVELVLVNARLSASSHRTWARLAGLAQNLIKRFSLIAAQSEADAARFRSLGAPQVTSLGNLKHAALPLPADETERQRMVALIGKRPVWLAASTHAREEGLVAQVHRQLSADYPDLLTILVPRHPERGSGIAAELQGLRLAQRSKGQALSADTELYLADTLGELGLFYRLSPIAFVGGSLVPKGGQNPLEPARLGAAVLIGPHSYNFTEVVAQLTEQQAIETVADSTALVEAISRLLRDPARLADRQAKARRAAEKESAVLARTLQALEPALARVQAQAVG